MKPVRRIFIAFGIAFLIFLVILGPLAFKILTAALSEEIKNHLISVREIKKLQIQNFFYARYGDINVLARNPIVVQSLPRYALAFKNGGLQSPAYRQIDSYFGQLIEHFERQYGYYNILLVDTDGNVVFGVKEDKYVGTNIKTGEYSSFTIGEVFQEAVDHVKMSDLLWSEDAKDFIFLVASPVHDQARKLIGVVIAEMPYSKIDIIISQRDGLGNTGKMYLVGEDRFMRSKSRFYTENTVLKLEVRTKAALDALRGNSDIKIANDFRNVPVISAYTPLDNLRDINWALLVEIDVDEAFNSIRTFKVDLVIIAGILSIITGAYLYLTLKKKHAESTSATLALDRGK
ncbi:MAG: cache domain-containing protein [Candidatus Loosdrechtia sp.]|uniref:cache domain-containing protein n=1 Tax=Candidatus Loosdrechtia sp. TaxID=3101272 RepID=UPI003A670E6C|nr:MAG: cache domain-containing protein [Candidatus Jettenia sp. AMX2]